MKTRSLVAAAVLSLSFACAGGENSDPEPDAGEPAGADAGPGTFSFYLGGSCEGAGDVGGTKTSIQTEARGWVIENSPGPGLPWCREMTPRTLDLSDTDSACSASAHLELAIDGQTITLSGSAQASSGADTESDFAQGSAGFTALNLRGGGGGVTRVRTTVDCSGSVGGSGSGLPGIRVEKCNGEAICGLSLPIPGLASGWYPGTSATFEETTDSPDDVLACLRIHFDAFASDVGTANAGGAVVITLEPLP